MTKRYRTIKHFHNVEDKALMEMTTLQAHPLFSLLAPIQIPVFLEQATRLRLIAIESEYSLETLS